MATKTPMPEFNFASGSKDIEVEAAKHRTDYDRARPKLLKWSDDDPVHIVRFLDDDKRNARDNRPNTWKGVMQHGYIKTVNKPKEFKGQSWPPGMPAICRYDKGFNGYFGNCLPCDLDLPKPDGKDGSAQLRMFARVVLRERVEWEEDGKTRRGVVDKLVDVDEVDEDGKKTGKKIKVPDIRYVEQSRKLFFQHLIGIAQSALDDTGEEEDYTVLDRDFTIRRTGTSANDTSYAVNPVKNSEKLVGDPGTTVVIDGEVHDLEGVPWDVNDERVLAYYESTMLWDLPHFFFERAVDEWHEMWFKNGGYAKHNATDDDTDDDEDERPARSVRKRRAARDEDDEPEDKPAARKGPARRAKPVEEEPEDEPEDKPATRRVAPKDDDEEEPEKPARRRPAPAAEDDDDDEEPAEGRLARHRRAMIKKNQEDEKPAPARADSSAVEEDDEEYEKV